MYYRFLPVYNVLRELFLPSKTVDKFCISEEIVCEASQEYMPGISMEDHYRSLVTHVVKGTTPEQQWRRTKKRMVVHEATVKFKFKNVLATPAGFFSLDGQHIIGKRHLINPIFSKTIHIIDKGFFASSFVTNTYFGHWLIDGIATSLLKEKDEELYLWAPPSWGHTTTYLDILGIETIKHDYVFFKNMTYCFDRGMNTNRRARIRKLKSVISTKSSSQKGKKVYVRRGQTGISRVINNEDALNDQLKKMGFLIIDVDAPAEEIINACSGAELTLSIEGSNFAHLLLGATTGATHIIINPAAQFNNLLADYMLALGDTMHTVVAESEGAGYRVDIPRLTKLIENILRN
ncbi:MAG: glycosyltransferase 61 family protein [Emcibacteraceae bacterium]